MIDQSKTKATPKIRWLLCTLLFLAFFVPVTLQADTWIVFDCNRPNPNVNKSTYWDIWKLDPDGDGGSSDDSLFGIALTNEPSNEWDPTYSVNDNFGSKEGAVVFVSDKNGQPHLYKMSIDGGYWHQLTDGHYANVDPCYSFDGTKVAYTSNQNDNWEIYIMDSDGYGIPERITHSFSDNRSPCFSKDGSKVYFISNRDTDNSTVYGDWEIYCADLVEDTIGPSVLAGNGDPLLLQSTEHEPCCSPTNPNIIVFASGTPTPTFEGSNEVDRINFELFSYYFNTNDTNHLTESWNEYGELWNSSMPCFSPNGQHIAWSADNWTNTGWLGAYEDRPFSTSYWKPNITQGASHQIWIRATSDSKENHINWFPPSYWGWSGSGPGHGFWNGGHMRHKHYNPSWDEQP